MEKHDKISKVMITTEDGLKFDLADAARRFPEIIRDEIDREILEKLRKSAPKFPKEMKVALITGISGQDGSYLAELLLEKDYEVWGTLKRNSVAENQSSRINHIRSQLHLEYADMTDMASLIRVLSMCKPDEVYNLAAQSHVQISFNQPIYTTNTIVMGIINLLEAVKLICPEARIYQASSSEMFGNSIDEDGYQRETTPMHPVSPYGCAKLFAHKLCQTYRASYNMYISCGILFNHESPRRGSNFVTNKVCKEAVMIKKGLSKKLVLGNLYSGRDWGSAKDYVVAMWEILQQNYPDDYVCATGIGTHVIFLVQYVFEKLGLDWEKYVETDVKYMRPLELNWLKGDSTKLLNDTNWKPKYTFEQMIDEMIGYWENEIIC